jgi:hypothetical protein
VLNEFEPNHLSNAQALRAYTKTPVLEYSKVKTKLFLSEAEKLI